MLNRENQTKRTNDRVKDNMGKINSSKQKKLPNNKQPKNKSFLKSWDKDKATPHKQIKQ